MQFVNPQFLWGLLFLAVPIIIHLFQFRRFKKVYFSNTAFLKEIKETSQQSRKLKHLLVLLMRLLAVAFLVIAFAQPIIPTSDQVVTGSKGVSIFIDNSFSMGSMGRDISLFDNARFAAREIINSYGESDQFHLLTGDFENRHQRLYNREQALDLIDEMEVSPAVRTVSEVFQRQQHALRNFDQDQKVYYIISDFQKNITDLENIQDTSSNINLIHLESLETANVSIDSVWFSQPVQIVNQTGKLLVQLTNHDPSNAEEVNMELRFGDQRRPAGRVSLEPMETRTDTVSFTINQTGWQEATLSITDYPIQFDDEYHLSFYVSDNIGVLTVHSGIEFNRFLSALFRGIPYMNEDLMRSSNINYSALSNYELIILNELDQISTGFAAELSNYLAGGGSLLVFPAANESQSAVNVLTSTLGMGDMDNWSTGEFQVGSLNMEDPVFLGVFEQIRADLTLPKATGRFQLPRGGAVEGVPLLSFRDNNPYVSKYNFGAGSVFISASPLDMEWNDLVSNGEIFVPLLYRAAIASGTDDRIAYTLGTDRIISVRNTQPERQPQFRITKRDGEFIPGIESRGRNILLNVFDQVRNPGFYDVFFHDELIKKAAFNYDRRESAIASYDVSQLEEVIPDNMSILSLGSSTAAGGTLLAIAGRGEEFWQWCIIIALLALLAEQLILRFWKTGAVRKKV